MNICGSLSQTLIHLVYTEVFIFIKASRVRRTSTSQNNPYYDKVSHSFVRARSYDLREKRILLRKEVSEWSASIFPGRSCDSHGRHATKSRTIGESQIGSRR